MRQRARCARITPRLRPGMTHRSSSDTRCVRASLRELPLRRDFDAGAVFLCVMAARTCPPASFGRRRAHLVRNPFENPTPGVIWAPEGAFRTESRREPRSRRQFLAGGRVSYVIPSEPLVPASFPRRRALLVRNPVENPGPGVIFSPEMRFSHPAFNGHRWTYKTTLPAHPGFSAIHTWVNAANGKS